MQNLEFWTVFGDRRLKVEIYRPRGGGSIQVLINNYLEGLMDKINGLWMAHVPQNGILSSADILILGEMIDGLGNTS